MTEPKATHSPASVTLYSPEYVFPALVSRSQIGPAACAAVISGSATVGWVTVPPTSERSSSRLTRPWPSSEIALILT